MVLSPLDPTDPNVKRSINEIQEPTKLVIVVICFNPACNHRLYPRLCMSQLAYGLPVEIQSTVD